MKPNTTKQINYLLKLTDKIGLIEHSSFDKPNLAEGYCVDDNARGLQVCLKFRHQYPVLKNVLPIYFNFINLAFQNGQLFNDLNPDLSWQKKTDINNEHYGRTLAALGETIRFEPIFTVKATILFDKIYSSFTQKNSPFPRVSAQIILGLKYYHSEDIKIWADSLVKQYLKQKSDSRQWFEPQLSYDNSRLPLALLTAYQIIPDSRYLQIALKSLDFLTKHTFNNKLDYFVFPGNNGVFGQQPIEAGSAVEAYSLAFQITSDKKYKTLAQKAFDWYHGQNILNVSLINPKTGGIYDGLEKNGPNLNQGAESVLSYLLAFDAINFSTKATTINHKTPAKNPAATSLR